MRPVTLSRDPLLRAQEWRCPVPLLVVAVPKRVHLPEHVIEAELAAELDRALRPVETELDAGVDVIGRADALTERERALVDDAALDSVEPCQLAAHQRRAGLVVEPVRAVARVVVPAASGLAAEAPGGDQPRL